MAMVTSDWHPLGNGFYRKFDLYTFGAPWIQDIDLDRFKIAAAAFGGPIALMKDVKKGQVTPGVKPTINIYNSAGRPISRIRWNSGQIFDFGWSSKEDLLFVQEDGSVLVYDLFGNFTRKFTMGQEAKDTKVIDCKIFNSCSGTGIAILAGNYRMFMVNCVDEPRLRTMAEVPTFDRPPSCWTVINQGSQARILVALDKEVILLDHGGQYDIMTPPITVQYNAIIEMAVSFNNEYLALFTDTGVLWMGSTDLKTTLSEYNTKFEYRPKQLAWCDVGAVVGQWKDQLLVIGTSTDDSIQFPYDSPFHLISEIDGLRIITNYNHEFLQKVPVEVEDVFKIGSMAHGALLFEASKEFQKKSQKADEYIREVKDHLDKAVRQCIKAAGQEFVHSRQRALLKAASFGKCFSTDMSPEKFVSMCQNLRVLNAIRDYNIGIPLSYTQLQHITRDVMIDRLVHRRHFCLAIRISQYLKIPESQGVSRILTHWAYYKVQQTNVDDWVIAQSIAQKLGDTPGVTYSEIARKAHESGRKNLAMRLLDFEPKAAEQVPLLLKFGNQQAALNKATESGDTDLIFTVLHHLKDQMGLGEFIMFIRGYPAAYDLYQHYCRQTNPKMLEDLHYQEDNYAEEAACHVKESYVEEDLDARINLLNRAQEKFVKARDDFSAKATEEQIKLFKYQRSLDEKLKGHFVELPLHDNIAKLIQENNNQLADQLKKEFKVPDRRFWWIKIQALGEKGDWVELERFSKTKKSPIGFEPFVEICMKYDQKSEAEKYVQKVLPEKRARCYVQMGDYEQAVELASQQKNEDDLNYILTKCGPNNRPLAEKIVTLKAQLGSRR